jgi:hypothetical protein
MVLGGWRVGARFRSVKGFRMGAAKCSKKTWIALLGAAPE